MKEWMLKFILLIVWIGVGITVFISDNISKLDYICVWVCYLSLLAGNCLNDYIEEKNNDNTPRLGG